VANDFQSAVGEVARFLQSEALVAVVRGTHQNKKHTLVLDCALVDTSTTFRILFRVNSRRDADDFRRGVGFSRAPGAGSSLSYKGHRLYVDTINPRSWRDSPSPIDIGVVYPLDSLDADSGSVCVDDLKRRGATKIFLVTCTDNFDLTWVTSYDPYWITYDAEDEDPAYHQRVKDVTAEQGLSHHPKVPAYASREDTRYLVRHYCDRCRMSRLARLNKPYPGIRNLHDAQMGEYEATCLKCGCVALDNYNWYGQS